jgi:hypothetical protein
MFRPEDERSFPCVADRRAQGWSVSTRVGSGDRPEVGNGVSVSEASYVLLQNPCHPCYPPQADQPVLQVGDMTPVHIPGGT